ncbi:MAG TPA: ATP-binding cassette domain-containing protein [Thermoanaerobaculia bacterium]
MTAVSAYQLEETILDVKNVTHTYGDRVVLRDLSFAIRNITRPDSTTGQIVALLGPSGMGKTTLFRVLAGLMQPTQGEVKIGPEGLRVAAGMVGVVFQNYQLFEHRTVLGNLSIAASQTCKSNKEACDRSMDMLQRFGLEDFAKRYPSQLSGGQRQRVAIAQQFLCSRHFLLMDEPFSGLDPIAVEKVCGLVSEVANLHDLNTIIVVTHNIEAGLQVADTAILLGRDRGPDGKPIPGARVQATYDLIERGLMWHPNVDQVPEFLQLAREVRAKFKEL